MTGPRAGLEATGAAIPALIELAGLPRWVLWRYEARDGKPTKVPYAADGRKA